MTSHPVRHRATQLLAAALAAVGLLAATLVAPPSAHAKPPPPAAKAALAAGTPDASGQLPDVRRGETTGDFLGLGYEQRAVIESGKLNIYDPPGKGGQLRKSTTADMHAPPEEVSGASIFVLAYGTRFAREQNLLDVSMVWTPTALYLAGAWGSDQFGSDAGTYTNLLLKLPADGSCASRACATVEYMLPNAYSSLYRGAAVASLALAVGQTASGPVIAVGMNEYGVYLFDDSLTKIGEFYSFKDNGGPFYSGQQPITALAFGPAPVSMLAVAVLSGLDTVYHLKLQPDGRPAVDADGDPEYAKWTFQPGIQLKPASLRLAIGRDALGQPLTAVGQSDGTVRLLDPNVTTATFLAASKAEPGLTDDGVTGLTFVDRWDGSGRAQDLAVARKDDKIAQVLRNDGSSTLQPQPLSKGKTNTDLNGLRAWFPGYQTGRFSILNNSRDKVKVSFASRSNAAYGCWFAPAFTDGAAFPQGAASIEIAPNARSAQYTLGGLTAGGDGACGASDFVAQWAAYLVVTPVNRPADTRVVKMVVSRSGQLTAPSAGGSLVVDARPSGRAHALGRWELRISGPEEPMPASIPAMVGKRLSPAADGEPVYRFDVPSTRWNLPVRNPSRVQAVFPPMRVQGTTDLRTWTDVGQLVPQIAPTRTSGTVTLGAVSFYWQNSSTAPRMKAFRVGLGDPRAGVWSERVELARLVDPVAGTPVNEMVVCPTTGDDTCDGTAAPAANGLDQAPLRIQLKDINAAVIPKSDPAYDKVYYRDEQERVLTGLIPLDGSETYTRVSPYRGAYANDGLSPTPARPPFTPARDKAYLSTTSTETQQIVAHLGGSTVAGDNINVAAESLVVGVVGGGKATGFTLSCNLGGSVEQCAVPKPTLSAPALYLTRDPDTDQLLFGMQFATLAVTSTQSLPLQQVAGQPEHLVAGSALDINGGEISLAITDGFQPADTIDTWLVTHGQLVPVRNLTVGGGN